MKKVVLLLILTCVLIVFAACGGTTTETTDTTTDAENTQDTDETSGTGEVVVIKIAHVQNDQDSVHLAGLAFEKYVEEQSNGSIDVQVYPNSELGSDVETLEGCLLGTVEIATPSTAQLNSYQNSFGILDMPFIFKDTETAFAAVDGELGDRLKADAKNSGFHVLGFYFIGNRGLSNSVKEVHTPDDMKGLDIRVMESPVYIATMEALGANPTPMAFSDLYTALQQGAVDGQDNSASVTYDYKFFEVQPYYSLTDYVVGLGVVTTSEAFFQTLTPEQQAIVEEGAKLYLVDEQRRLKMDIDGGKVEELIAAGVTVTEISPENHDLFVEAVQPVYDQFIDEIGEGPL